MAASSVLARTVISPPSLRRMVNERVVWTVGVGMGVGGATRVGGSVLVAGDGRGRTSGVMLGVAVWSGGDRKSETAWLRGWKDAPTTIPTMSRARMANRRAMTASRVA